MRTVRNAITALFLLALALGVETAHAETRVTVSLDGNTPPSVHVRVGEEVRWTNLAGATAHIWFFPAPMAFYIGLGGAVVRFDQPGTYEYMVHITGLRTHTHTGNVLVH